MTKHTPGPWVAINRTAYALNTDGVNRFSAFADCGFDDNGEVTSEYELIANAKLIAAAPDLLDALCVMTVMHRPCSKPVGAPGSIARKDWEDECVEYERAMDAIRKATS